METTTTPITTETAETAIIETVEKLQGCKEVDLVAALPPQVLHSGVLLDALDRAVSSGGILRVGYMPQDSQEREKNFLLPQGTKVILDMYTDHDVPSQEAFVGEHEE